MLVSPIIQSSLIRNKEPAHYTGCTVFFSMVVLLVMFQCRCIGKIMHMLDLLTGPNIFWF